MISERWPVSTQERRFYLELVCLILAAWGLLFAWQRSAYAGLLGHEALALDQPGILPAIRMAAFLLSWFLMTLAMMVPGSLPLLNMRIHSVRHRRDSHRLAWLILVGYLAPWILFGLLAYIGDGLLHEMAEPGAQLATLSDWIPPAILSVAGLYQFTTFKHSNMDRGIRFATSFPPNEVKKFGPTPALNQGLRLGVICLGSCWSLMLLMFAVGHNRLDWMLAMGMLLAAERLAPWGRRLAWLVGVALMVWAAVWALA